MTAGRVHRSGHVGQAEANLIASWPAEARIEDVEEAIKAAARDSIRAARDTMGAGR